MNTFKYFIIAGVIALSLVLSINAEARVLDIIVGGSNAGLECKTDAECGPDKYCNQEQYYCTACKVPPKVWTGTECKCPAGLVDKSDTECVQCLTDDNCAAKGSEMFCNTDTYACVQCKEPKEWKDNACACPAKTHEAGDDCICDNPNTNLDEFNFCACTLTPASCATTELNLTECMCCPIERPVTIGNECKTCASVNPSKPVWDSVKKECVECKSNTNCPVNKQCVNQSCVPCPGNQVRPVGSLLCKCPSGTPTGADTLSCQCDNSKGYWLQNGSCTNMCTSKKATTQKSFSFSYVTEHYLWIYPFQRGNQLVLDWMDTWVVGGTTPIDPSFWNSGRHNYDGRNPKCGYNVYRNDSSGTTARHGGTAIMMPAGAQITSLVIGQVSGYGCNTAYNIAAGLNRYSYLTVCPADGPQSGTISGNMTITYDDYICPIAGMTCNAEHQCIK